MRASSQSPDHRHLAGPPSTRSLIVNADDLGLSHGVTGGILEAHRLGIVTSASLMVRSPCAADAAARSSELPALSIGLHLDLGEWAYRGERWAPLYQVVALDDGQAVNDEMRRQVDSFLSLVGRDPTHLDSHQHVHLREPVRSAALRLAEELGVPLRHFFPRVRYCGLFYGQTAEGAPLPGSVTADALIGILSGLEPGATELACHPGYAADLDTMYREERAREVVALCDPRVRRAVQDRGIELRSFAGMASAPASG